MTPTVRRHPRSVMEAWPDRHPYAVEHYRPVTLGLARLCSFLAVVGCAVLVAVVLVEWAAA